MVVARSWLVMKDDDGFVLYLVVWQDSTVLRHGTKCSTASTSMNEKVGLGWKSVLVVVCVTFEGNKFP